MEKNIDIEYNSWLKSEVVDLNTKNELKEISNYPKEINDRFYKNLSFGTGGLRGILGAGTNRMNIYTVAKASQGLANYVIKHFELNHRSIAVSYDSRIMSKEFAQIASSVFAANHIKVYIYSELMPTPCLSYAVRYLRCSAGIMITASHNPAKYNGYKVYGFDGCQITTQMANDIYIEIEKIDIFKDVIRIDYDECVNKKIINYIPSEVYDSFIEEIKMQSVLFKDQINRDVSIIYSPLNGTGLKPILRALNEEGFTNVKVVKEQENPDGNFPTCPYPNPEVIEAMELGMKYAKKYNAEILLATDPDCDRVGIAVKDNKTEEMKLLSGNETGILLLDYICSQRIKHNKMPKGPILIKTIVTTDMAEKVASSYGVKTINLLTGFKFIGEKIGFLEKENKLDSYILGFEESYGYLSGTYVRDKDAVNGVTLICEMFAYYKTNHINLIEKLDDLYNKYGYYKNTLYSYNFEGIEGFNLMQSIMRKLRHGITNIGEYKVLECLDYLKGIDDLPISDVLKFTLDNHCSVVIRPSGTEPKLKVYISVNGKTKNQVKVYEKIIHNEIDKMIYKY